MTKKYVHREAFCLMTYRDTAGNEEQIWNSRDGVTPFTILSRQGLEARHVDWQRDACLPNYKPRLGDRVFVDLTIERAREIRREYVEKRWSSLQMYQVYSSQEDAIEKLAQSDLDIGVGVPDLYEVALVPYRSKS